MMEKSYPSDRDGDVSIWKMVHLSGTVMKYWSIACHGAHKKESDVSDKFKGKSGPVTYEASFSQISLELVIERT